ncbi:Squalene---hopene cyclase [Planctomycetales bacterium 10988]|nr:Squalene---hopene cyclase [Planctomycetales bacterium 10988]
MNTTWNGRIVAWDPQSESQQVEETSPFSQDNTFHPAETDKVKLFEQARRSVGLSRYLLLSEQKPEGYWQGELEGDTILESEFILLQAYLGHERGERAKKAANYLLKKQNDEGGWSLYPGGPMNISASVKAYFALKLTGHDPSSEALQQARRAILAAGGADEVNTFTRFYLAFLGQIEYRDCPAIPTELMLLPKWLPISLYAMSSWARTMVVPMSVMTALKPCRKISPSEGIRELFIRSPEHWPVPKYPGEASRLSRLVGKAAYQFDRLYKWLEKKKCVPLQKIALKKAEAWMRERFENSDGLGAIFPSILWSIIIFDVLGYAKDSPEQKYSYAQLEKLIIEEEDTLRVQPCESPVWDTAIASVALSDSGVWADHEALKKSAAWLLDKQVLTKGDWSETVTAEPGGWCFEHANAYYPDTDDTAMVMMALMRQQDLVGKRQEAWAHEGLFPADLNLYEEEGYDADESALEDDEAWQDRIDLALDRGEKWLYAMQNSDGGWGAFDRNNHREMLSSLPFADHNAMNDPSTPDLTARILELLGKRGKRLGHSAVNRAVAYLEQTQEADGSWFGRWGVNYIYGTWQVLQGLAAIDFPQDHPMIRAGVEWLRCTQQPSGGWGESPESYGDLRQKGIGEATASQTAWALLGLIAAGEAESETVRRGIQWLATHQNNDGSWTEEEFTGTGFPQVFYLRYHLYPLYFPLMALSRWLRASCSDLTVDYKTRPRLAVCCETTR